MKDVEVGLRDVMDEAGSIRVPREVVRAIMMISGEAWIVEVTVVVSVDDATVPRAMV